MALRHLDDHMLKDIGMSRADRIRQMDVPVGLLMLFRVKTSDQQGRRQHDCSLTG